MGRVLGIDPGTRRCGVAISDSNQTMAFPRLSIDVDDILVATLVSLVNEESVSLVVVGRPVSLKGTVTSSTEMAEALFFAIKDALGTLEVIQFDERLTTVQAQRSLSGAGVKMKQHRERIDSAAAVVLLQNYLDGSRAY